MADIFSLIGRVTIDYAQAENALRNVSDALQRASGTARNTSDAVDDVADILDDIGEAAEEASDSLGDVGDETDNLGNKTESSSNRIMSAFKKIGGVVATAFAVDKVVDFGKSIVDASATVAAEQSAFEQIMGDYSNTAQEKINEIADTTGMVSTRLTPYMTSMTAKFKGLGYDIDDATTLAQDGLTLAADAAAFWDKSLDDSMSALNSFINGSYEGGEAIGLFANDTQMASYAVEQGIVSEAKEWANLDEARKQATRLEYAQNMMEASGATGQAAKEADQYANVQANLTEKWRQFKAQIGEPLLQNIVIPAMDKLSGIVDKASTAYKDCTKWISEHHEELKILGGVAISASVGVGAFFLVFKSAKIISSATKAVKGFVNGVKGIGVALTTGLGPIGLVIGAISALVAAFIYFWNTSEEFRNFWIGLWESITTAASGAWEAIKNTALAFWDWITLTASAAIAGMKEGWNSFKESVANIWNAITDFASTAWETIKNVVQVGIMFIVEIITFAVELIMIPWRFIWENVKEFVIPIWESIKSTVSNAINAVKTTIETVLNAIKTFFTNVWNSIKNTTTSVFNSIKSVITNIWHSIKSVFETVLNAIKSVVSTAWNNIKSVTSSVFNAVKGVATSVWNSIKSVIESVVNGIKSVVSSVWNSIKSTTSSVFNGIKDTASSVWNSIKSAIETPINAAKNAVKSAIDKMKSFFNFSWSLPPLKLPHINISGKFSLNPPSVPKFGISWYKKAMDNPIMFTKPTLFDFNPANGTARGAGEAGDEVMIGKNTMLNMIREAVALENANISYMFERLIKLLEFYMPELIKNMAKNIYLDTGVLVGEMGGEIDYKLGNISKMKERGM